jgi:hypothetical protein
MATIAEPGTGAIGGDRAPFFAVSLVKLAAMSVCTFGIYELYWFYKNWQLVQEREKIAILPFWRAFFAYFFCIQCFSRIRAFAQSVSPDASLPAVPLAAGWIAATLLWRLPDPFWLVSMLSFLFLLPVQAMANWINATVAPGHDPNRRFTACNIAAVVAGGIITVLAVIAAFNPDD